MKLSDLRYEFKYTGKGKISVWISNVEKKEVKEGETFYTDHQNAVQLDRKGIFSIQGASIETAEKKTPKKEKAKK